MTPETYAVLTELVDELIRDFAISHGQPLHEVASAIKSYVDDDLVHDLMVSDPIEP